MAYVKEIVTAVGTLACAVGIGFVMQSSETSQVRYGKDTMPEFEASSSEQGAVEDPVEIPVSELDGPVLDVSQITLTSALDVGAPAAEDEVVLASASPETMTVPTLTDRVPMESCEIEAVATPSGLGLVDLFVSAPCYPNERLTVHHSGMMITETTGEDGLLDISIPALTDVAVILVAFANGEGAVAETPVPSLEDYDRVVLQWKGNAGFEIHAREFGAAYGAAGHVWSGAPGDPVNAIAGDSGFLIRLGDTSASDPLMADVYTYPSAASHQDGDIDLSVEAEVSLFNCGLDVEAQSLEIRDGSIASQELVLSVPGCDTIGSFLVLNNLIQDLKVVAR